LLNTSTPRVEHDEDTEGPPEYSLQPSNIDAKKSIVYEEIM